ncbi:PEP-CTERM sorting domain-containing protein [Paludisphaera borealis]|uniref:PEP-CTERM protein-sorting domain-containing protein n=1 Tax=Paludisphaera borealis TaxID=1387353 RepID=A0A1U7CSX3_9BACT|nr:PEP-CTERM sorting domain-containing protein [Paludisphaera borealis]APW61999.1 hypothetical protein BSF38_03531 [Paludisphaera borealis]
MMTRRFCRKIAFLALAAGLGAAQTASASSIDLISNGGFEAGGSLTGWTVVNQPDSFGNWYVQTGTGSPLNGLPVAAPPEGNFAAMTDQGGNGSHVLYQDFVVPIGVTAATLSFDLFIHNWSASFASPDSLDFTVAPNQQARVDIITTAAAPFSVAAGDVLLNLFQTNPGDPLVSGYTTQSTDLTAFLSSHGGETLRLRFAEVDRTLFFNFGVDNVSLMTSTSSAVPEPSGGVLLSLGVASLGAVAASRRRPAA